MATECIEYLIASEPHDPVRSDPSHGRHQVALSLKIAERSVIVENVAGTVFHSDAREELLDLSTRRAVRLRVQHHGYKHLGERLPPVPNDVCPGEDER